MSRDSLEPKNQQTQEHTAEGENGKLGTWQGRSGSEEKDVQVWEEDPGFAGSLCECRKH